MSGLKKGVLKLAGGAGLSQLIVVGATPLLTRLYTPEAFGELAVFASIYTIGVGLATLKLEQALVLPAEREVGLAVAWLALRVVSSASIVALAVVGAVDLAHGVGRHLYLLPLALLVGGMLSIAQQWCLREAHFGHIAKSSISGAIANVGCAAVLAAASATPPSGALVTAYVLGMAATAAHLLALTPSLPLALWRVGRTTATRGLLSTYRQFPLHVMPGSLATTVGSHAMPIVVTACAGAHAAGLYAIANRLLALPTILVGNSVQSIVHAELNARIRRGDGAVRFFERVAGALVAFAAPTFVAISIAAPWLFGFVFGPAYRGAGEMARWIALGAAATFVAAPLAPAFIAAGRTRLGFALQALGSFAPILAFVLGFRLAGVTAGLVGAASVALVCSALQVVSAVRAIRRPASVGR